MPTSSQIWRSRIGLSWTYRAVIVTEVWLIRLDTALMSTPRSMRDVANVRRPEWLDAWSRPAHRHIRLNSTCIVFGLKLPPFLDLNSGDSGCRAAAYSRRRSSR
jgi:hypothetical protein